MNHDSAVMLLICIIGAIVYGVIRWAQAPSKEIHWTIPGTTRPQECDLFELMKREDRGEEVNSSELIISYHFLQESVARDIATNALTLEEAAIFHQLRAIRPTQFPLHSADGQARVITWLDYANLLGHDADTFWLAYDGISAKITNYLKSQTLVS